MGYLWLLRGITVTAGSTEEWLRLPSLVAGIALLPLLFLLGRRIATPAVGAGAVWLAALSPGLVRYSTELKQYSVDATLAVALVLLAARADPRRPGTLLPLAAAGAASLWLSHAAALVLAGVGLHLLSRGARSGRRAITAVVMVGATWAATLGALYAVSLRQLTENEFLTDYWQAGFPENPWVPHRLAAWTWDATVALLDDLAGFDLAVLAVVGAAVGFVVLGRGRGWMTATVLLTPAPAIALAAALELYPYRGRLALFVVPLLLVLLAAAGLQRRAPARAVAIGLIAVVAAPAMIDVARQALDPVRFAEAEQVVDHVAEDREPGQAIFVTEIASGPFAYYGARAGIAADAVLSWRPPERCDGTDGLGAVTGQAWVVFAYTHSAMPTDEDAIWRSHLDQHGRRLDLVEAHDAFAALYDFDASPTDASGSGVRTTPVTGCVAIRPA